MEKKKLLSVLIAEDNEDDAILVARSLRRSGYELIYERVDTPQGMGEALDRKPWDIILVDYRMPGFGGLDALNIVRERNLDIPVILVSGVILEDVAIEAMRQGACDCIKKDHLDRLSPAVERELAAAAERRERRQAEQALRESEEQFRVLAETSPAAIVLFQGENIVYVNPSAERLTGYTEEELLGMRYGEWIHDDFKNLVREWVLVRQQEPLALAEYELRYVTKGGEERWALFSAGRIDYKGKPAGIATIFDITGRKRAEEQLRDSLREKEILLHEIHHRVKNNLQIVSTLLDLQSDYIDDEQSLRYFQESQDRINSMALVHEALYRSRDLARIDFTVYLEGLTDHLFKSYVVDPKRISLKCAIAKVTLGIDEAIPCGLIVNELVSNSLKHAFPQGRHGEILVQCQSAEDGLIRLRVSDNGVGLPPDLDFMATKTLGLQLVTMLVRQVRGELTVQGEVAGGTAFTISFRGMQQGGGVVQVADDAKRTS
ncbi:response regulator [Pelobacter propionicus]|uniref:Signal transduction histidine kinase n=1 Tax=Pelobacter propionicus (strain DSM 2379 / NBRC 103807 / OttBd1) TaxID=338966 RepID=A1ATD7_PELPD|nr:response regulator [Pelobacter propionicus]ABL00608.1 signal transduction histidine kinase [Pelobacter propionicus DSM 2379]